MSEDTNKQEDKIDWRKMKIPMARDYLVSLSTCGALLETDKEYLSNFVPEEDIEVAIRCLSTLNSKRKGH